MWPSFINDLTPFNFQLRSEFPRFLKAAFENKGIAEQEDMFLPVKMVALLGDIEEYLDCPNLPDWYRQAGASPGEGCNYYWFDFDITDANGKLTPCRCVFNIGHPDANDGRWGAVWDRTTEELLINISSTGDGETTLELDSVDILFQYQPHDCWLPFSSENIEANSFFLLAHTICRNKLQFEDLVRIAIEWCVTYIGEYDHHRQYPPLKKAQFENVLGQMQVEILQGNWASFLEPYEHQCKIISSDIFEEINTLDISHFKADLIKTFEQAYSSPSPWRKPDVICLGYEFGSGKPYFLTASGYTHLYDASQDLWAMGGDQCFEMDEQFIPDTLSQQIQRNDELMLYCIARMTCLLQEVICDRPTPGITICLYNSNQNTIHRLRLADD